MMDGFKDGIMTTIKSVTTSSTTNKRLSPFQFDLRHRRSCGDEGKLIRTKGKSSETKITKSRRNKLTRLLFFVVVVVFVVVSQLSLNAEGRPARRGLRRRGDGLPRHRRPPHLPPQMQQHRSREARRTETGSSPPQNLANFGSYSNVQRSLDYLTRFGYLLRGDDETGNLVSSSEYETAIKRFQRFAHLPATGKLDVRTVVQLSKPRCGVPDFVDERRRRRRRGGDDDDDDDDEGNSRRRRRRKRRRGDDDGSVRRRRRFVLSGSKWNASDLTYKFVHYTPDLEEPVQESIIASALRLWSTASPLVFTRVFHGDADINVDFLRRRHGDDFDFDGQGNVLGHAFFPDSPFRGEAHFDVEERWTKDGGPGIDLFMVAAHEFGHTLGLSHSDVFGSLMFPWYQGHRRNYSLPGDDVRAVQRLYGTKSRPLVTKRTTTTTTTTTTQPTTTTTTTTFRPVWMDNFLPEKDIHVVSMNEENGTAYDLPSIWAPIFFDPGQPPAVCDTTYDAVSVIRGELFMFKGPWFWRVDGNKRILPDYPKEINKFWYSLPPDLDRIDAIYERPTDNRIVIFRGQKYWVFDGNVALRGFPHPISDFGFEEDVKRIDAAFVWSYNLKTYFISGHRYWKFDEYNSFLEHDYPRDIVNVWNGVPTPVDTAFLFEKRTYFLKDRLAWSFDDKHMSVESPPQLTAETWLRCVGGRLEDQGAGAASGLRGSFVTLLLVNLMVNIFSPAVR